MGIDFDITLRNGHLLVFLFSFLFLSCFRSLKHLFSAFLGKTTDQMATSVQNGSGTSLPKYQQPAETKCECE